MPDAWAAPLGLASTWLLTYLLHSAVLIGGAWLATRFVTVQPASREFVWRLAILGGVVTATGVALQAGPPPRTMEVRRVALSADAVAGPADLHPAFWVQDEQALERAVDGPWTMSADEMAPALQEVVTAFELIRTRRIDVSGTDLDGGGDLPSSAWPVPQARRADAMRVRATLPDASPECAEALRAVATGGDDGLGRLADLCVESAGFDWRATLLLIWLVGAAGAMVPLVTGRLAVRSLDDSLEQATPRSLALLAEVAGDVRGVRVASSGALAAPCALPGRTIGLPTRCEDALSDEELRAVLAHELAHVSRRDVWWSGFFRVAVALLWVQPLNRFALRRADQATELACDDWAVSRTGERVGLATSISRVAEWSSRSSPRAAAVSMVGRGEGAAAERVRRILFGDRVREPWWVRLAMALLIAAPLPWAPSVPPPPTTHGSIQVEAGTLAGPVAGAFFPASGDEPAAVVHRVLIARMRAD